MSLFPAYSSSDGLESESNEDAADLGLSAALSQISEAQLLASDDETAPCPAKRPCLAVQDNDFYLDTKYDGGNLPVTTLYYPGRPQYDSLPTWKTVGLKERYHKNKSKADWVRYYSSQLPSDTTTVEAEVSSRTQAFRRLLAEDPQNEQLWLKYIKFQEQWAGGKALLHTVDEAEAACVETSGRLRAVLLRLRLQYMPHTEYRAMLHKYLSNEESVERRLELYVRIIRTMSGGAKETREVVENAISRLRQAPLVYPQLLYAYGCCVRDAGLSEMLVLLVELVAGVCLGVKADLLPAPPQERLDTQLQAYEDKAIDSGLPLHAVWTRVERARADAHWHAPHTPTATDALDPQRTPLPADITDLLLPLTDYDAIKLLAAQLLRLAKVPLFPASSAMALAVAPGSHWLEDEASGGEALLPFVTAARRLPSAHATRFGGPAVVSRLIARFLDPPHYFNDENGYLRWVTTLWDLCCERSDGEWRTALLCWRMRWWLALILLIDTQKDEGMKEARRIMSEARGILKKFTVTSSVPFAMFARIQRAVDAPGTDAQRARGVAVRALRSALSDPHCPPHHRLYIARIVGELDPLCGTWGAWCYTCAALGRPLPPDEELVASPPSELVHAALNECQQRCSELELQWEVASTADKTCSLGAAMLPSTGEWLAAQIALLSADAVSPLPEAAQLSTMLESASPLALRYWEQGACAWVARAARTKQQARAASILAPLFPHNAFLALVNGGAPMWSKRGAAIDSPVASLASLLPHLLRAEHADWAPQESGRVASVCARREGGGPLWWYSRLEAEAHATRPRIRAALFGALATHPHHKWLYVRGAALCLAEAASLPDALFSRQMRLHALPDELCPITTASSIAS